MTMSMTGFSRAEGTSPAGALTWELRTVNHRFLEVTVRLPEELRSLEPRVRQRLTERLQRGKLDCTLRLQTETPAAPELVINEALADAIVQAFHRVSQRFSNAARVDPMEILRWPGVIRTPPQNLEPLAEMALALLDDAILELRGHREREGARIAEFISARCAAIASVVASVRARRPEVLERLRAKWVARLADLPGEPDRDRLEQELVLAAQKLDVDEELDRLDTHLAEIRRTLAAPEPAGRRLDFLVQELNREANTLAAKAGDGATSSAAVDLKVLIEQVREQVQNIE